MDDAAVMLDQQGQVVVVDLGHVHGLEARAEQAQAGQAGQRALAVLGDGLGHFLRGFMHVHVNAGIQLVGQHAHLFELVVADRVGCVRAEGDADARVLLEIVEQLQALAQRLGGVERAGDGEVQHGYGDLRTYACLVHALDGRLRVEVHVGEAADAALDLFGDGQVGAVADEGLVDPFALGRPDVLVQPGHQRQVVGDAAQQGHRRMAVGVDQAGGEQAVRQFAHLAGGMAQGLGARGDQYDVPVANAQAMLAQHHASRLHGHQPGRQEQKVERGLGHGSVSVWLEGCMEGRQCIDECALLEVAGAAGLFGWRLLLCV